MDPRSLVQQLGGAGRLEAMRALVGGVNARELRSVVVADDVLEALIDGLADPRPPVRFWSIQVLDHLDDVRAVEAIATCLDDPVPRVRRNAAHALGCIGCKPSWDGSLPAGVLDRLGRLAADDPSAKVRAVAALALACDRPTDGRGRGPGVSGTSRSGAPS